MNLKVMSPKDAAVAIQMSVKEMCIEAGLDYALCLTDGVEVWFNKRCPKTRFLMRFAAILADYAVDEDIRIEEAQDARGTESDCRSESRSPASH